MAKQQGEQKKAESWDEIRQRAKDIPNILPTLKMTEGKEIKIPEVQLEFLEDFPRRIDFKNKRTGADEHFFGISAEKLDTKEQVTLPVSAVSLQNALGKLNDEYGTLKGLKVRIYMDYYQHKTYGKTLRYNVSALGGK